MSESREESFKQTQRLMYLLTLTTEHAIQMDAEISRLKEPHPCPACGATIDRGGCLDPEPPSSVCEADDG